MGDDIHTFVLACSVCVQIKTLTQPSDGLIQPLSILKRSWSHITRDFVIGLPPSYSNTVVDRFSKSVHFIPLPKLPSTKEAANLMITHVFQICGLPVDMVLDRDPQFRSHFWKSFCKLICASVSFSSGFHPQSHGQTMQANQQLEMVLWCMVSQTPSSWSLGLSTLLTPSHLPLQDCPPLSAIWATSPLFSNPRRGCWCAIYPALHLLFPTDLETDTLRFTTLHYIT